jgi:hypothetical protein
MVIFAMNIKENSVTSTWIMQTRKTEHKMANSYFTHHHTWQWMKLLYFYLLDLFEVPNMRSLLMQRKKYILNEGTAVKISQRSPQTNIRSLGRRRGEKKVNVN